MMLALSRRRNFKLVSVCLYKNICSVIDRFLLLNYKLPAVRKQALPLKESKIGQS